MIDHIERVNKLSARTSRLSIVMGLYNIGPASPRGIESLLAQDFADFELLLVDDASNDETAAVCEHLAAIDNRIKIITQDENTGLAGALNRGIGRAESDLVVRMDHDDWAHPARLRTQYEFMQANPDIDVASCAFERVFLATGASKSYVLPLTHESIVRTLSLGGSGLCHPGTIIRKACFYKFGFYDPYFRRAQDRALWLRWRSKVRFANLRESLVTLYASGDVAWEGSRNTSYWQVYKYDTVARWMAFPESPVKHLDLAGVVRSQANALMIEPIRRQLRRLT